MNLKNKTEKELWDMLEKISNCLPGNQMEELLFKKREYDIHKEIIRREEDNEGTK